MILTSAVAVMLLPPGPVQVREYAAGSVSAPLLCVPLLGSVPTQPPLAAHEVALVEFHVSVDAAPLVIALGEATSETVGTTLMPAIAAALLPPGPLQIKIYAPGVVKGPVLCVPLGENAPLQLPDAAQAVALVELHVSSEAPPLVTTVGEAVSVTVGMTFTVVVATVLLPPAPSQLSEYVPGNVRAPVLCAPLGARLPLQSPDAVHEVELLDDQVKVEAPPFATDSGDAVNSTVGMTFTATLKIGLVPPAPVHVRE